MRCEFSGGRRTPSQPPTEPATEPATEPPSQPYSASAYTLVSDFRGMEYSIPQDRSQWAG